MRSIHKHMRSIHKHMRSIHKHIRSYSNHHHQNTQIIPFIKPDADIDHIRKIVSDKKISYVLKIQLLREYFVVMDKFPNSSNRYAIWSYRSNILTKKYESDPETKIIDQILSQEEP